MQTQGPKATEYSYGVKGVLREVRDHGPVFRGFVTFLFAPPFLFVFVYHALPTIVLLLLAMMFMVSISPLYVVQGSWLAAQLSGSFVASVMFGLHCYYTHVVPLDALSYGRSYSNVDPTTQAIAFADATMLQFTGGTVVDDTKTLGMQSMLGGNTYCVAPVGAGDGRINFWAVGVNCCGRTSDFTCDDAGNPSADHGFVVPDPAESDDVLYNVVGKYLVPPEARRDMFLEAISMAESVHSIASETSALLVQWTGQTKVALVRTQWLWLAFSLIGSLIYASAAGAVLTRTAHERGVRYLVKAVLAGATPAAAELLRRPTKLTRTSAEVRLLGFTLPVLAMVLTTTIFSFAPCFVWGNIVRGIFLTVLGVTVLTITMSPKLFDFGVLLLAVSLTGAAIGRWNFGQNAFHFCAIYSHKAYSNVPPDASSLKYQDAGKMYFAANASLNVDQSIGFIYDGDTYCAAPIVSSGGAAMTYVDFWAVGRDCCAARGAFNCFPSGDLDAKSGIVLRDSAEHGLEDDVQAGFLQAVQAAADNYNLPMPQNPMLIEWGRNLNVIKRKWLIHAISVILVVSALSFVVFAVTSFIRPCSGRRKGGDEAGEGYSPTAQQSATPAAGMPATGSGMPATGRVGGRAGGRGQRPVAYH